VSGSGSYLSARTRATDTAARGARFGVSCLSRKLEAGSAETVTSGEFRDIFGILIEDRFPFFVRQCFGVRLLISLDAEGIVFGTFRSFSRFLTESGGRGARPVIIHVPIIPQAGSSNRLSHLHENLSQF